MQKLKLLDLFSGIGGFSLGLERTGGFETVAFCEIEDYPRRVLNKHWPEVLIYEDIRTLTADTLSRDGIEVDAICGGFPCQDISTAGKGAGIEGERSGLWTEYARLIGELRPRVVFVENVSALLGRGLDKVLGDLAALGYDAWWDCIPASAVGAPHRRDRMWIVAYTQHTKANNDGSHIQKMHINRDDESIDQQKHVFGSFCELLANPKSERRREAREDCQRSTQRSACRCDVPDANRHHVQRNIGSCAYQEDRRVTRERPSGSQSFSPRRSGATQSGLGGTLDGISAWLDGSWEHGIQRVTTRKEHRADRLKCLGNAVVPQIPELIGRAWLESQGLTPAFMAQKEN